MPISSGAGGRPNSYFNPANALTRRSSVPNLGQQFGSQPAGYYYGGYGGGEAATPRSFAQVIEMPDDKVGQRFPQNSQASVSRSRSSNRRCCPCPSRSRKEMRMPTMPKGRHTPVGNAITRRGCCIFLLGLLALAVVAGLIAGLYFLCTGLTDIRMTRAAFYLIPGRRTGDLMWVVYGQTQECQPVTSSTTSTTSTTTTADPNSTAAVDTATTTVGTTLISCADTTFSYVQVTLGAAGGRQPGLPVWLAASVLLALASRILLDRLQ